MRIKNSLLQSPTAEPLRLTKDSSFNDSLDLTKRRYNLFTKARVLVRNNLLVAYAFSNISCSLVLKFNDNTFQYFNNEYELNDFNDFKFEIRERLAFCSWRYQIIPMLCRLIIFNNDLLFGLL